MHAEGYARNGIARCTRSGNAGWAVSLNFTSGCRFRLDAIRGPIPLNVMPRVSCYKDKQWCALQGSTMALTN